MTLAFVHLKPAIKALFKPINGINFFIFQEMHPFWCARRVQQWCIYIFGVKNKSLHIRGHENYLVKHFLGLI